MQRNFCVVAIWLCVMTAAQAQDAEELQSRQRKLLERVADDRWYPLYVSPDKVVTLDMRTARRTGTREYTVWFRWDDYATQTMDHYPNEKFNYLLMQSGLRCAVPEWRTLEMVLYLDAEVVYTYPRSEGVWGETLPGSIGESVLTDGCNLLAAYLPEPEPKPKQKPKKPKQ